VGRPNTSQNLLGPITAACVHGGFAPITRDGSNIATIPHQGGFDLLPNNEEVVWQAIAKVVLASKVPIYQE